MNLRNKHREEGEVHTGPLNDILFILLLFFLIVSTMANPNVVKLSQPKSKSDTKAKQTVVVSIDANKQFYVGTTKVTVAELKAHLAPFLARPGNSAPGRCWRWINPGSSKKCYRRKILVIRQPINPVRSGMAGKS